MNKLSSNLVFLRKTKKITQSEIHAQLGFKANTWSNWENNISEPAIDVILQICEYFGVTTSQIIEDDLAKGNLIIKEDVPKIQAKGNLKGNPKGNLKTYNEEGAGMVMEPILEYKSNKHNVYDLDSTAAAGVALFIEDKDKRKSAPTLYFPWLGPGLHIRIAIAGDSMHPTVKDGDKTIATWVTDPANIREGNVYVILDKEEGIVCKRIYRHHTRDTLEFVSDNDIYKPYTRHLQDITALFRISEVTTTDLRPGMSQFQTQLRQLQTEMKEIRALIPTKRH